MADLANDTGKDIAVFINDFRQEFAVGLHKLSLRLGRPLHGVILLDREVKEKGLYDRDTAGVFEEIVCDFSDDVALRKALKILEPNLLLVSGVAERNQPYLQRVLPHTPIFLGQPNIRWNGQLIKPKCVTCLVATTANLCLKYKK